MGSRHPESELIAYLKDELSPADRETVTRHLQGCGACRDTLAGFRAVLDGVERDLAAPPPVHWPRYRAELRARLEADRGGRGWMRWWRPLPVALSAGVAAALVALVLLSPTARRVAPPARSPEGLSGFEEVVLGTRLDLLREYPVVERLDLLEDLDVIRQLDRLAERRES